MLKINKYFFVVVILWSAFPQNGLELEIQFMCFRKKVIWSKIITQNQGEERNLWWRVGISRNNINIDKNKNAWIEIFKASLYFF